MPSGKKARQERQQAVTPPPGRSGDGPSGARRASPRTLAIAGAVILVVIVAVVLGIVLTQQSSSSPPPQSYDGPTIGIVAGTPAVGDSASPSALTNAPEVEKLLKGIPQKGMVLGNADAPVTLIEYVDVQCPYCAEFETTALPTLIRQYVRAGKLKVELNVWNIIDANDGGDDSLRGQKATIGASNQNRAFNYISVLYWNQADEGTGWLNDGMVSSIAASVTGLTTDQFATDANSAATQRLINQTDRYAQSQQGFTGTPVILLAKGNETPTLYGTGWGAPPMDTASLTAAIDKLLQ